MRKLQRNQPSNKNLVLYVIPTRDNTDYRPMHMTMRKLKIMFDKIYIEKSVYK
jgi:hypothetical protein